MRRLLFALATILGGCGEQVKTADPCSIVSDQALTTSFSTPVKSKALTGPRRMGEESVATCDVDFSDGQWLVLTVSQLDKPIGEEALATFRNKDDAMTEKFGFPVFYGSGEKELDAFATPTKRIHVRLGKNAGGGSAGSFPDDIDEKLDAMLTALSKS
jgi:hypothetical protein